MEGPTIHGNIGSAIAQMMRNVINGRDTRSGVAVSEYGILEYHGHRRVLLDEVASIQRTVIAVTASGTQYIINVLSKTVTRRVTYSDLQVAADFVLRPASIAVQCTGSQPEIFSDVLFGYDIATGVIVVFDHNGERVRRSSTVRDFLVLPR